MARYMTAYESERLHSSKTYDCETLSEVLDAVLDNEWRDSLLLGETLCIEIQCLGI
jgi:hypothetical protein